MVDLKRDNVNAGETTIKRFLVDMNKDCMKVCVWKSSDRWGEGIAGQTDVDLLVDPKYFKSAINNLIANQWFPVLAEPWRRFEGVVDFVSYQTGFTQHIHLHSRIVSGEKLVKSFSPQFTSLYMESAREEGYPYFVKPELEFVTFILRISLKLGWRDFARIMKRRCRRALWQPFIGEYNGLRDRINVVDLEALLEKEEFSKLPANVIRKASGDLSALTISDIGKLRTSISQWRNVKGVPLLYETIRRRFMKGFMGIGKSLTSAGVVITVCGADGSGKTTLASALSDEIGKQINVQSFYLGGSAREAGFLRSCFRTVTTPFFLVSRKLFRIVGSKHGAKFIERVYTKVDGRMMDRDKLKRIRLGRDYAKKGGVTIYDRYPLFTPYGDGLNGDCLIPTEDGIDLLILISVGTQVVIERRPNDNKDRLKAKVEAFDDFGSSQTPFQDKVFHIDGTDTRSHNVALILQQLNGLICQNIFNPKGEGYLQNIGD